MLWRRLEGDLMWIRCRWFDYWGIRRDDGEVQQLLEKPTAGIVSPAQEWRRQVWLVLECASLLVRMASARLQGFSNFPSDEAQVPASQVQSDCRALRRGLLVLVYVGQSWNRLSR